MESSPIYSCVLLGSSGVGKTSIASNFFNHQVEDIEIFERFNKPTCYYYNLKPQMELEVVDPTINLIKPERLKKIVCESSGYFLVYDVTRPDSLTKLEEIWNKVETMIREDKMKNRVFYIVGNKCDLTNKVDKQGIDYIMEKVGAVQHFLVSAHNHHSYLDKIFKEMYENIVRSEIDQIE